MGYGKVWYNAGKAALNGDVYTVGKLYGNQLGEASLVAGTLVVGKVASKVAASVKGGVGKLTANDISFSDKFSKPTYKTQVADRGWTNQTIADTINKPVKTSISINKYTGNSVTAYYIDKVHYVAVDNVTKKVIQVADMNKANWKFDLSK